MSSQNQKAGDSSVLQTEREAIADLLHLCLYGDAHIAIKEGDFIADAVKKLGWGPQTSFEGYASRSIAGARAAHENAEKKEVFLKSASERLKSREARTLAVNLCTRLFAADGSLADKENALLAEIRAALK
jgi:hypothetical protein